MITTLIASVNAVGGSQISDGEIGALNLAGAHVLRTGGGWGVHFAADDALITLARGATGLDLTGVKARHEAFPLSLSDVARCLRLTEALSRVAEVKLVWAASGVIIDGNAAGALLQRWAELEEPPVLWIVALELEKAHDSGIEHRTRGLGPFVGHELRVRCVDAQKSREAARTLARAARYALMNGPISPGLKFLGIDDLPLRLDWSDFDTAPGKMVTIYL